MSSISGLISGGGGGNPVNTISKLNLGGKVLHTDESGGVWLKTGNAISPNTSLYPDAEIIYDEIGTATYDGVIKSVSQNVANANEIHFNNDGTRMFILDTQNDNVTQWNLSSAYNVNSASYAGFYYAGGEESAVRGFCFNTNGTKMYIVGTTGDGIYHYTLSSAFTVTSGVTYNGYYGFGFNLRSVRFNASGTKVYIMPYGSTIFQYALGTAFQPSTIVEPSEANLDVSSLIGTLSTDDVNGIFFNSDGSKMYALVKGIVYQFELSTAYEIKTAQYYGSYFKQVEGPTMDTFAIPPNGDKLYLVDAGPEDVYQFSTLFSGAMGAGSITGPNDYVKLK